MQYFKNTDLSRLYPISEKAVRNWVKAAKDGRMDLELYESAKRPYIANTPQNIEKIEKIVEERKKYTNKLTHKESSPGESFYDMFTEEQLFDIINSLEVHHELPLKYTYFGKGAEIWEDFVGQQVRENYPNAPLATGQLLEMNQKYIDYLIEPYSRVNIVCIGAENFSSLEKFLKHIVDRKVVGRLILIATSPSMLRIAKRRVNEWLQDRIELEIVERDMQYERFHDLLLDETFREDAKSTLNLFLMMGSIIYNFQSPSDTLRMIHNSLGSRDIFIHDAGLDTKERRGFNINFGLRQFLSPRLELFMDLLGVDSSSYDIERFYDRKKKQRIIRLRFRVAVSLEFNFAKGKRVVHFNKDDHMTIFRFWHNSTEDVLKLLHDSGFNLLHASHTKDRAYLLTISNVGKRPNLETVIRV